MSLINNKKFFASALSFFLLFLFILPFLTQAADTRLINCGDNPTYNATTGKIEGECDFKDFIKLINDIINWIIGIAGVIFTISAIYGGFLYVTSGVNAGNKEKAKGILGNTLIGFIIILTAWLIVYTLVTMLVNDSIKGTITKFIGS